MSALKDILGPHEETIKKRIPYDPVRKTAPYTVLRPYTSVELAQCQTSNNPLRTRPVPLQLENNGASPSHANANGKRAIDGGTSEPVTKRRRSNDDQQRVTGHYNSRPNRGIEERRESPIIGLKAFNNWIKTVLIAKFARSEHDPPEKPKVRVLDLGCGKGGDLMKWEKAGTELYVGLDVAKVSIEQARERLHNMRRRTFEATFHELDCFEDDVDEALDERTRQGGFNVVSMQFCLHYAFETEEKVRQMLSNVAKRLNEGGVFIGTIPDPEALIPRLSEIPEGEELSFGNSIYRVTFDEGDATPRYGHRYTFFLEDAVEDVPEYVVYWDMFVGLAKEVGLQLVYCSDFTSIFEEERGGSTFATLLRKMKVVDNQGNTQMDIEQFEAATMYLGFAFIKKDAPVENVQSEENGRVEDVQSDEKEAEGGQEPTEDKAAEAEEGDS